MAEEIDRQAIRSPAARSRGEKRVNKRHLAVLPVTIGVIVLGACGPVRTVTHEVPGPTVTKTVKVSVPGPVRTVTATPAQQTASPAPSSAPEPASQGNTVCSSYNPNVIDDNCPPGSVPGGPSAPATSPPQTQEQQPNDVLGSYPGGSQNPCNQYAGMTAQQAEQAGAPGDCLPGGGIGGDQ